MLSDKAPNVEGEGAPEREARREPASPACGRSLSTAVLEPFLREETENLPPGWRFRAFASRDDKVGTECDQQNPERHKHNADKAVVSGVTSNNPTGTISVGVQNRSLKRMVDPLTKTNEEATGGESGGGCNGESLQDAGAREQEHNHTNNHKNLIPVIKRKFGQWVRIFHKRGMNGSNVELRGDGQAQLDRSPSRMKGSASPSLED